MQLCYVLINDKYISTTLATYKVKISSRSQWCKLWGYKVTENKISNDTEQDIYIPQIIIAVITHLIQKNGQLA